MPYPSVVKNVLRVYFSEMTQERLLQARNQASPSLVLASRKPQRVTITVPWSTYQTLIKESDEQGRSLSNMAAYWLERQADAMAPERFVASPRRQHTIHLNSQDG